MFKNFLLQTPIATISNPKSRVLFQSPICTINSPTQSATSTSKNTICSTEISTQLSTNGSVCRTSSSESNEQFYSIEDKSESSNDCNLDSQKTDPSHFLSDDEDFCSSTEELDRINDEEPLKDPEIKAKCRSEPDLLSLGTEKSSTEDKSVQKISKGVSLGNLKFAIPSVRVTPASLKKSKSSSLLADDKTKLLNESDVSVSEVEEPSMRSFKSFMERGDNWDISKINYFQNTSTLRDEQQTTRNSISPITKSTQRMPKFMQVSFSCLLLNVAC